MIKAKKHNPHTGLDWHPRTSQVKGRLYFCKFLVKFLRPWFKATYPIANQMQYEKYIVMICSDLTLKMVKFLNK